MKLMVCLDDIFILGKPEVIEAGLSLNSSMCSIVLSICDQKCELSAPSPLTVPACPFPVTSSGTTVLGIAIGSSDFISDECVATVQSGESLCSAIADLADRPVCLSVTLSLTCY